MPDRGAASARADLAVRVLDPPPVLAEVPVTVWTIDLAPPEPTIAAAAMLLSDAERAAASRYRAPADRAAFIARRAARRMILGAACGVTPAALAFAAGAQGRPRLPAPGAPEFSTSRSGATGLCAVAARRVGVDLEVPGTLDATPETVARVLSPAERSLWRALDPAERPAALLRAWTCKEAVAKALGHGLSVAPHRLDVWRPGGSTVACDASGRPVSVREFRPAGGALAAVAVVGAHPAASVVAWHWPTVPRTDRAP